MKDDRFDADVLADTVRDEHDRWRPLPVASALLAEIKALTRDRDRLLETQQTIEAQLRSILEAYHPAPARLFSAIDRQITLAFINEYPTPASASRLRATRVGGFCKRHNYTGRVAPDVLADRLRSNLLTGAPRTVAGSDGSSSRQPETATASARMAETDQPVSSQLARYVGESVSTRRNRPVSSPMARSHSFATRSSQQ